MNKDTIFTMDLIESSARCPECGRVFDLFDETDAAEWYYGHDCECDGGES